MFPAGEENYLTSIHEVKLSRIPEKAIKGEEEEREGFEEPMSQLGVLFVYSNHLSDSTK